MQVDFDQKLNFSEETGNLFNFYCGFSKGFVEVDKERIQLVAGKSINETLKENGHGSNIYVTKVSLEFRDYRFEENRGVVRENTTTIVATYRTD